MSRLAKNDIVSVDDLSAEEIERIFALAEGFEKALEDGEAPPLARGLIMATLFYEPSTRTRLSFESAMHRLGGAVISCPDMKQSSTAKGESLADTARVVSSYADLIVVRHPHDGAARVAAEYSKSPVVNAGDGSREHPTQTLCDLYVLGKKKGYLAGLNVAICGDLKYGRTVHSLMYALARFGANIIAVPTHGMELPAHVLERLASERNYTFSTVTMEELRSLKGGLDALYMTPSKPHQMALFTGEAPLEALPVASAPTALDAFYLTRPQRERHEGEQGEETEYMHFDRSALKSSRTHEAVVMHPLPRTEELGYELDTDPRAVYFEQAAAGVPVRMALIAFLVESAPRAARLPSKAIRFRQGPAPRCVNPNCISRHEGQYLAPRFGLSATVKADSVSLRCELCERDARVEFVGHARSRRYYRFDETLAGYVRQWIEEDSLAAFETAKQAEEAGYEPYRRGPQREIMNGEEVAEACEALAGQIIADLPELGRAAIVGVVSRGAVLATRLRSLIEARTGAQLPCAAVDVYAHGEQLLPLDGAPEFDVEERTIIVVDDVIHSGWTIQRAMTALWQRGRPGAVKLAVLVDRGHRAVPIRPNYVGKHIPTARAERVQVRLLAEEKAGRRAGDRVVVYSLVEPANEAANTQ